MNFEEWLFKLKVRGVEAPNTMLKDTWNAAIEEAVNVSLGYTYDQLPEVLNELKEVKK